jgi:hypothetical protein
MPDSSPGQIPSFMEQVPPPVLTRVRVTNHDLPVWKGRVKIDQIKGWQENPRILMHVEKFIGEYGRPPNQDDIFEIMKKDPEVELKRLMKDIMDNGVRHEIWLSKDGELLDGNRRYFAARYALENMEPNDPRRPLVSMLPVIVLDGAQNPEENKEMSRLVVVQQNFAEDLKRPWTDLVKAKLVFRDHEQFGYSKEELAKRYDWKKDKVDSALKTYRYIQEFIAFVTEPKDDEEPERGGMGLDEGDASDLANEHYQKFNEAQKSYRQQLETNPEFKRTFFRLLAQGKFKTWTEVRYAYDAWVDPAIRKVLMSDDPDAAKRARIKVESKAKGEAEALTHEQQIDAFTQFLSKLEVDEILSIPKDKVQLLREKVDAVFASKSSKSE